MTTHRLVTAARPALAARAARILAPIEPKLRATEALFAEWLASDVPFIHETGEYVFAGGGKRMRPALLLLCARLLGHDSPEEVTYAAVVEFIHTATLVHDDILDHAELRRGQRTVHSLWGTSRTVLFGDWLYTTAMKRALAHGNLRVIDLLCDATLRMTEGELMVLQRLGDAALSEAEYFDIIERKTARLFAAACAAPALMSPSSEDALELLTRFGRSLGLCFQLVDDLLDYTARESDLGKPVLSDLREGKLTLPLLLAMPRLAASERAAVVAVLEDRSFERTTPDEVLALVQREGTLEQVGELARRYADDALSALAGLPEGEARRALELAPDFVLSRRA
jgi:octaprenyl-diphosphate synthase